MWMTSCTGSVRGGFVGFWKKSVEFCRQKKKGDFRLLAVSLRQVSHVVWGRWKIQVHLSPYVEKPINSNVIKSFVPELRSRQVFFMFRDSYVIYMDIRSVLRTGMNMSIAHIRIWLWYNRKQNMEPINCVQTSD